MQAKVILLVCVALILSACTKTSEDKVTEAFKEYVKTDFGNPKDFIEITQFVQTDTLSSRYYYDLICGLDSLPWLLSAKQQLTLERLKQRLESDSTFFVQHEIKVRIKNGKGGKEVRKFFVVEKEDGKWSVQDHELMPNELPPLFEKTLSFMAEVTDVLKILNGNY